MKIIPITKYQFKGKEYNSLKDVKNQVENTLGEEVLDLISKKVDIRHKDILILFEILTSKEVRTVLTECLNVEFEKYDEFEDKHEVINILDLK